MKKLYSISYKIDVNNNKTYNCKLITKLRYKDARYDNLIFWSDWDELYNDALNNRAPCCSVCKTLFGKQAIKVHADKSFKLTKKKFFKLCILEQNTEILASDYSLNECLNLMPANEFIEFVKVYYTGKKNSLNENSTFL